MNLHLASQSRDNNFNLLRMIAAVVVILSHSFPLCLGDNLKEPLFRLVGMTGGQIAVDVFFITSGFLIYGSFTRRPKLFDFAKARILRIYPALFLAIASTVFILGPIFTNLPVVEYFSDTQTWRYLVRNCILFVGADHYLPGVFTENVYAKAVNGSLWTLPHEVRMYTLLAIIGSMCLLVQSKLKLNCTRVVFLAATLCALAIDLSVEDVPFIGSKSVHLFYMFFAGATLYEFRKYIRLSSLAALAMVALLVIAIMSPFALFDVLFTLFLPYLTLWIAYLPSGFLRNFNKLGDYSYGVYIYAFPVQQIIALKIAGVQPLQMALMATPIVVVLGILSWHLLEKPMLKLKG